MDRAELLLEAGERAARQMDATTLFVIADETPFVEAAVKRIGLPLLLATGSRDVRRTFQGRVLSSFLLSETYAGALETLARAREILTSCVLDGTIGTEERVLCLVSYEETLEILLFFDVGRDDVLAHLREEVRGGVDIRVMERILRLAGELAREGREGHPVGTVFVLGDAERVLAISRQVVINPFQGHPESARNILDDSVWETAKEFAQIDGAFVIREDGVVLSAGRYLDTDRAVAITSGLGGRHLAAASVTHATDAVAVVVSQSGTIRVFRDGRVLTRIGRL